MHGALLCKGDFSVLYMKENLHN